MLHTGTITKLESVINLRFPSLQIIKISFFGDCG
jgi:hypothetical protein